MILSTLYLERPLFIPYERAGAVVEAVAVASRVRQVATAGGTVI